MLNYIRISKEDLKYEKTDSRLKAIKKLPALIDEDRHYLLR